MVLFYALLLAHLIADFLQPAALVKWMKRSAAGLLVHAVIYGLLTAPVLAGYGSRGWLWLVALAVSHALIDHIKSLLGTRPSPRGFYVFVADQILHVGAIALAVFGGDLADMEPSPILVAASAYWNLLPFIVGYVAGTFGVSILVFEAGRTSALQAKGAGSEEENNTVIYFEDRLPGMLERAIAITLILGHLYFLVPLSFVFSIYQLAKRWQTDAAKRLAIELSVSSLSAVVIGLAIAFF